MRHLRHESAPWPEWQHCYSLDWTRRDDQILNGAMDAWNLQVDASETSIVLPNNAYIDNTHQAA